MSDLCKFFTKIHKNVKELIPGWFLDSLLRMYDYTILQEVKESLYYYNEEQISRDIQNYIFAVNFEKGTFKDTLAKAAEKNKLVLLDFYTDTWGACVVLDQLVFQDKKRRWCYNCI